MTYVGIRFLQYSENVFLCYDLRRSAQPLLDAKLALNVGFRKFRKISSANFQSSYSGDGRDWQSGQSLCESSTALSVASKRYSPRLMPQPGSPIRSAPGNCA